jgi:hypothetical protein
MNSIWTGGVYRYDSNMEIVYGLIVRLCYSNSDLRNHLKNDILERLMHLTVVNGPNICTYQCDDLITSSVKNGLQMKSRRKLPSRNKGNITNKYNLLFYSSKKYYTCSYKIIKMN